MVIWQADFSKLSLVDGDPRKDLILQAKDPSRASLVQVQRTEQGALSLNTQPGDTDIVGSGAMERCDVYQSIPGTADPVIFGEGHTHWVGHSILLPDGFQAPSGTSYVLFDFHNTGDSISAPFHVNFVNTWKGNTDNLGLLQLQRFTGNPQDPIQHPVFIGPPIKNMWYDFVYHIRWSSGSDGYFKAWLNAKLVMDHKGPNLFKGQGVYLKLANYHLPVNNTQSSVIHDKVIISTSSLL